MAEPKNKKTEKKLDNLVEEIDLVPGLDIPEVYEKPDVVIKKPRYKRVSFWLKIVAALFVIVLLVWLINPSRLFALKALGVRAPIQLTVTSQAGPKAKKLAVSGAKVTTKNGEYYTNDEGVVLLHEPYGKVQLTIEKPGYETTQQAYDADFDPFFGLTGEEKQDHKITIGLTSVGLSINFKATDWLSEKPITSGTFSIGKVASKPTRAGLVVLNIPPTDEREVSVKTKFGGKYIDRTFKVKTDELANQSFTFVPAGKHYYVKGDERDIYRSNLDGSSDELYLSGQNSEGENVDFMVSPNNKYAAYASTRHGLVEAGGVNQRLYIVNLATKRLSEVDKAPRFGLVAWDGDNVVYKAHTTEGEELTSASAITNKKVIMTTHNSIGDVIVGYNSTIYRANDQVRIARINKAGSVHLASKVTKMSQLDYHIVGYQIDSGEWHAYDMNINKATPAAKPETTERRFYSGNSPNGQWRMFTDVIDGKKSIGIKNISDRKERVIYNNQNLGNRLRWVGDAITFSVGDTDYALSINGGSPKPITK